MGAISLLQLAVTFGVSALYIAQVINPVIFSFLRQEGDVLFQLDNARTHTAIATQHVLRGVRKILRSLSY